MANNSCTITAAGRRSQNSYSRAKGARGLEGTSALNLICKNEANNHIDGAKQLALALINPAPGLMPEAFFSFRNMRGRRPDLRE
jgi:hypothetical protein